MKKLICALVLLAMLVPAAAMAELPPTELDLDKLDIQYPNRGFEIQEGFNGARYVIGTVHGEDRYTGQYYLSGALDNVIVNFGCGCTAFFSADGVMEVGSPVKPDCPKKHESELKPVERNKNNSIDDDVYEIAEAYGWDSHNGNILDVMKGLAQNIIIPNVEGNQLVSGGKGLMVSVRRVNSKGETVPQQILVHYGPIVYSPKGQTLQEALRVYGDRRKDILSWGDYNLADDPDNQQVRGKLNHYGVFSDDKSQLTVYDAKNRLKSIELWMEDDSYWEYWENEWFYSADGDPDTAAKGKTPPEEVLTKLTVTDLAAVFPVSFASSVSGVSGRDIGTPVVIGDVEAETVATMMDNYTSVYEMKVVGDTGFKQPIDFLLPYGAGQNRETAEQFTYTVEHEYAPGKFIKYSTEPADASYTKATFTEKGILLPDVSSFSPFTVQWGDKQASTVGVDSLPSTGDNSNLLAYACLLLAGSAMLVMLRRRAHQ